jgi:hypothetical protein
VYLLSGDLSVGSDPQGMGGESFESPTTPVAIQLESRVHPA